MAFKYLKISEESVTLKNGKESHYSVITLDSPPLNALSTDVFLEIKKAIQLQSEKKTRVVVFTGEGKAFAAGADISEMQGMDETQARTYSALGNEVFSLIENANFAAIAMVNGFALGGGLELAMACDFRILSENAQVGLPELTLGLIPGFGGTQRLSRIAGSGNARWLTFTGDRISSAEALRMGIAQKVVPTAELKSLVSGIATSILQTGPHALETAKRVICQGESQDISEAVKLEISAFASLFTRKEPQEGLSAFLEKRAPTF